MQLAKEARKEMDKVHVYTGAVVIENKDAQTTVKSDGVIINKDKYSMS